MCDSYAGMELLDSGVASSHSEHEHYHVVEPKRAPPPTPPLCTNTIRQHYYPEGGWGWVIVVCAMLVQILAHGMHGAVGVTMMEMGKQYPTSTYNSTGKLN